VSIRALHVTDVLSPNLQYPRYATPQDARDIINFLDFLLRYLYHLPRQINEYRKRMNSAPSAIATAPPPAPQSGHTPPS
jgi:hypothetical protein